MLLRYSVRFLFASLIASMVVWDYTFSGSHIAFDATALDNKCIAVITTASVSIKVGDSLDMLVTETSHQLSLFGKEYK